MWDRPDMRYIDFYAPALMSAYVGQAGLTNLTNFLAEYRLIGILKRYIVSPLSLGFYLCVHTAMQAVIFIFSSSILLLVAECIFNIHFHGDWAIVIFVSIVCITCFFILGFLVNGLFKSTRSIHTFGQLIFFIMFFMSGAAFPPPMFPSWLQTLRWAFPLTHVVEAFSGVWLGDSIYQHINSLLFLTAMIILSYLVSIRLFKWEV